MDQYYLLWEHTPGDVSITTVPDGYQELRYLHQGGCCHCYQMGNNGGTLISCESKTLKKCHTSRNGTATHNRPTVEQRLTRGQDSQQQLLVDSAGSSSDLAVGSGAGK